MLQFPGCGLIAEDSVPVRKGLSCRPFEPGAGDQLLLAVTERWGLWGKSPPCGIVRPLPPAQGVNMLG